MTFAEHCVHCEHDICCFCKKPKVEDWRKSTYPCNVCDAPAIGCYRPDIDIKGFCFCKEHQDEVFMVYRVVLSGDESIYKPMMEGWKHK